MRPSELAKLMQKFSLEDDSTQSPGNTESEGADSLVESLIDSGQYFDGQHSQLISDLIEWARANSSSEHPDQIVQPVDLFFQSNMTLFQPAIQPINILLVEEMGCLKFIFESDSLGTGPLWEMVAYLMSKRIFTNVSSLAMTERDTLRYVCDVYPLSSVISCLRESNYPQYLQIADTCEGLINQRDDLALEVSGLGR